ncbi:MAG: hypothetical protein V3T20_07820 [Gemmatimonadota bacterium]
MRRTDMKAALLAAAVLFLAAVTATGSLAPISGTCVAVYDGTAPAGMTKYRVHIEWDTYDMGGHGMDYVTLSFDLVGCPCVCDGDVLTADEPAGFGLGEGDCLVFYVCEYLCSGMPEVPGSGATLKLVDTETSCVPGSVGMAEFVFFSRLEPGPEGVHDDVLALKAGPNTGEGKIEGVLPSCTCETPAEHSTWGVVKAIYR